MHTELSRSTKPVPPETRETRFDGPQPRGVRAQAVLGASGSTRPAAGGARLAHRRQWRRPARTISESTPLECRATARRQATARCPRPARLAEPRPSEKWGSGHGGRRSATIGGMADSDDPSRDPAVPAPPKLPEVDSPPPEDVLDEVPPKEELVKRARPADEIVEEQPSVEELLDRDR